MGNEHAEPDPQEPWRARLRLFDERLAIGFWIVVLSVGASFVAAIVLAYLRIDPTQVEAGVIGAFLGSSPIILTPRLARLAYEKDSSFRQPRPHRVSRAHPVVGSADRLRPPI
jgi:hypothetical protein